MIAIDLATDFLQGYKGYFRETLLPTYTCEKICINKGTTK